MSMERQPVTSSNIASVGYDAASMLLEVEFTSGDVYQFADVPEQVHIEMMGAGSVGSYFNQYIRHNYPYVRL